jgi:hypothetical protein
MPAILPAALFGSIPTGIRHSGFLLSPLVISTAAPDLSAVNAAFRFLSVYRV